LASPHWETASKVEFTSSIIDSLKDWTFDPDFASDEYLTETVLSSAYPKIPGVTIRLLMCSKKELRRAQTPEGTTTRIDLFLRKSSIQVQSPGAIPYAGSLPMRLACQTLSKALETARASPCLSVASLQR
jgi:hypothetical protein